MSALHASWGQVLAGKVAVVTGAARGIGRSASVALARSGAHIVGIDVCSVVTPATKEDLDETAALVRNTGQAWRVRRGSARHRRTSLHGATD